MATSKPSKPQQTPSSSDDIVDSSCPILALNEDCLLEIFSYLSMKDILSIEEVCISWKALAPLCWKRFKLFDLRNTRYENLCEALDTYLPRCAPYLEKIY